MSFYTITPIRQLISVVCQICSKALCYRCYASGSLNVGDVGCWELVKVGGVDTKMYRTGHPHACSINLTTFWYRSCVAHAMKAERCAPPGVTVPSLERAFVHWSATKKLISLRHKRNVDALSLSLRSVSTEHWRHRSFTMSCLDVMYPAYGHYASYAPTAPAFISNFQVRNEHMWKRSCDNSHLKYWSLLC